MLWECSQGCTEERPKSKGHPGRCRPHAEAFRYTKALKSTTDLKPKSDRRQAEEESGALPKQRGKGLKRTQRRETAAEKRARLHFNEVVKSWPCWFRANRSCEACCGKGWAGLSSTAMHRCVVCQGSGFHSCGGGARDAHHLVPKQFIRRMFQGVLPEDQFVAILHNPLIGAPLCREAHDAIEAKRDRIYFEDLTPECIEYVSSLPDFVLIELERQCPKRPELQPSPTNKGSVAAPETEHV